MSRQSIPVDPLATIGFPPKFASLQLVIVKKLRLFLKLTKINIRKKGFCNKIKFESNERNKVSKIPD